MIRSQNLKPIPIELYIELKKRIQESNIPIVVELFDWTRLPDNFHWNIEAQHEIVFSNIEMMAHEPEKEYKKS